MCVVFCTVNVHIFAFMSGCFCNMFTCVCCVLYCLYCFFLYCFFYVYLFLFVLSVLVQGLLPPNDNSIAGNNNDDGNNNNNNNNNNTLRLVPHPAVFMIHLWMHGMYVCKCVYVCI